MNTASKRLAAVAAERRGDVGKAIDLWRAVTAEDPGDGDAWARLASLLARSGALGDAERVYRRLLSALPGHPVLLNNLGMVLRNAGRFEEAMAAWKEAASVDARFVEPLINIGVLRRTRGALNEALRSFEAAVARAPDRAEAQFQLGHTLQIAKQFELAAAHLTHAARLDPMHARARYRLAQCYLETGDFAGFATMRTFIEEQVEQARRGGDVAITPWFVLPIKMSNEDRRAVASAAAAKIIRETMPIRRQLAIRKSRRKRIHVGYIASDFRQHALMHLIGGMMRRHDRGSFKVSAYAVYPPDVSEYVARLRSDVDAFHDISELSTLQAAKTINDHEVDLLVDLSGFTAHARPDVLAARPAPLQLSWLGYAGTISGEIYDYLIADRTTVPENHADRYFEKIIWMPHSYQINDDEQPIAPEAASRSAEGLPEGAFVFACFCQIGRIERERFQLWMQILGRTPLAVLWLLSEDALTIRNLRAAAEASGIDPARLVFARRVAKPEHLARLRLTQVVLDTGTYGAHTTASDALWAGVPFLTTPGDAFASRVGASLLRAIGLPELIADSAEAYVEAAVALAKDPARLAALARKLAANRRTTPLFDTAGFVRTLEAAYRSVWSRYEAGVPPASILIPAGTG